MDTVTREELLRRLDDPELAILDVRTPGEYMGRTGAPCDPRWGRIPGARNLEHSELIGRRAEEVRALVGLPEGAELACYCHSGQRSAMAAMALSAAGYRARNYEGSFHDWARDPSAPVEADGEGAEELADGAPERAPS